MELGSWLPGAPPAAGRRGCLWGWPGQWPWDPLFLPRICPSPSSREPPLKCPGCPLLLMCDEAPMFSTFPEKQINSANSPVPGVLGFRRARGCGQPRVGPCPAGAIKGAAQGQGELLPSLSRSSRASLAILVGGGDPSLCTPVCSTWAVGPEVSTPREESQARTPQKMDRVTRYPIFSIPHSARITGLALDGDTSYTIELVGVGPEEAGWNQDRPQARSPDHKAQMDLVKTGATHSGQAFPGQWSLRPVCLEDDKDGDMRSHHLGASSVLPRQRQDLEQGRWAVIQGQAVRKGGTGATLCGTSDHGDPRPLGHLRPTPLEENRIDREQIDFLAARRQFIHLEQAHATMAPPRPPTRAAPPCAPPGASPVLQAPGRPPLAHGSVVPRESQVRELFRDKKGRGWPLGSGIPAVQDPGSRSRVESPEAPKETPIEREIRLAQEREADLREQRGLRRAAGDQELVEIPTRPVLTKVSLAEAPRWDRGRPSLYVQRDMVQETQREEDHRREGLQAARASTPDWASEHPQPGLRRSMSSDSILGPTRDARAADPAPASRRVKRISPEAYQPYLAAQSPQRQFSAFGSPSKPSGLSAEGVRAVASPKALGSQRQLPESSGKPLSTKQESAPPLRGPLLASEGLVRWDHFRLRPLRFRVPDVPQQPEDPQARGWEAAGAPVWRLQKSLSSDLLEREVESVLRREREVAEERRSALFPEVFSPPPEEDPEPDSRSSSRASGIVGSYSVSESPVFTPIHLHSGLVWKAEAPAEEAAGQRKKELWYAGINPADRVNSEILGATRVTRHKNAMAERWEAGLYAIEGED